MKQYRISFQTAVIRHFLEVSSRAYKNEDINTAVDHLYAMIGPYVDDEIDRKMWEDNVKTRDPYEYAMNKVKICTIILYRMGMLPMVKYPNRVYEENLKARRSHMDDMAKQVAEDIHYRDVLITHLLSMSNMIKEHMEHNMEMHVDLLWMYLTPYITFEDQENWETNNDIYGNQGSGRYDPYFFVERKKRICMDVMDRAGFLWSRSVVDVEEVMLDEGSFIEDIGSPRPRQPARIVDNKDEIFTEDGWEEYGSDDIELTDNPADSA